MRLKDYIRLSWDQLRRRKVVTGLCALGIAIGSASIIVALSFGESISHYSSQQMNRWFKMDELTIYPAYQPPADGEGPGETSPLTAEKLEIIRSLPGVKAAAPFARMDTMSFTVDETKRGYVELIATDLAALPDFGYELRQGSASLEVDRAIIVSYAATVDLYDERATAAERIQSRGVSARDQGIVSYPLYQKTIVLERDVSTSNGEYKTVSIPLRVIGVTARPEGVPDYMIRYPKEAYISIATAEYIRSALEEASNAAPGEPSRSFEQVKAIVTDTKAIPQVQSMIEKLKLEVHSNLYQQERMSEELLIVRLIFGGAGLFILCVASLTIIVAMTMATYQRRRQIGVMKVLGATLGQVRNMFMFESALLGVLGGLLGILLSFWVVWAINAVIFRMSGDGANSEVLFISFWVLPIGMLFALLTGMLSGLYPAVKASRTDALTAIKRE